MTPYRPKLRAHVALVDGKIVDSLLRREMEIEGTAAALAARLDGSVEWEPLRDGLIGEGHSLSYVENALRAFMLLHYVEGAGDELAARLQRVVDQTEDVPMSILAEARFACQGSGACCSSYSFGPLSQADLARLDELDLAGAFPAVEGPYVEEREGGHYLRKIGERCVFLAGDKRCGLHAAFGVESKPSFCRLYPLDSFGTVDGIRVVDRGTCSTFGISARVGLPLYDDMERVRSLLPPPTLYHPVALVDGRGWDYGLFLRFTGAACDLVQRELGSATDTLHAIARWLDALALALASCPLEPGQPDDMADAVLAIDGASWYRPPRPAAAAGALAALGELIDAIGAEVTAIIHDGRAGALMRRFIDFRSIAEQLKALIEKADGTAAATQHPRDVEEALRISLRQQLFGRRVLVDDHAGAGLVRIGLIQLFALAGARLDAGDRRLTAADLSRGHMLAMRVFNSTALDDVLGEHDEQWRPILDGIWLAVRAVG